MRFQDLGLFAVASGRMCQQWAEVGVVPWKETLRKVEDTGAGERRERGGLVQRKQRRGWRAGGRRTGEQGG